jgi:hypothetical protein
VRATLAADGPDDDEPGRWVHDTFGPIAVGQRFKQRVEIVP